ncbi:MAG: histidine phosphatase family protein [Chloroflexi bacterium]|nr:histidine phosphatase family protein [Chloroflexota bacterium]
MTRIVLVRHGQTAWNREVRFRGQADVELDEFGLQQAQATGRYLAARWPVVAVYASPLRRATQTAEAIARAHGLTAHPLEGLLDINFGEWQGLSPDEVAQRYPALYRAWWEAPHTVRFPGGERLDDVRSRVVAALDDVIARHPEQAVALVSHTVANRVLLCAVLGWGNDRFWRLRQETCAVNVFDAEDDGTFTIVLLNDTCHLQGLSESERI